MSLIRKEISGARNKLLCGLFQFRIDEVLIRITPPVYKIPERCNVTATIHSRINVVAQPNECRRIFRKGSLEVMKELSICGDENAYFGACCRQFSRRLPPIHDSPDEQKHRQNC